MSRPLLVGLLLLAAPAGIAQAPPRPAEAETAADMGSMLRLERVAGRVRRAAEQLRTRSETVVSAGRIHSLSLLQADLANLQRELAALDATLADMEARSAPAHHDVAGGDDGVDE